jgi:hypothetical protein
MIGADCRHFPRACAGIICIKIILMPETEDLGSFLKENKKLAKDYLDTRLEIYRLQAIRSFSKFSGYLLWLVISVILLSLFIVFAGLVAGFRLSEATGSYTKGFGLTTLLILVLIILIALLRRVLFINPIIRTIINRAGEETTKPGEK